MRGLYGLGKGKQRIGLFLLLAPLAATYTKLTYFFYLILVSP